MNSWNVCINEKNNVQKRTGRRFSKLNKNISKKDHDTKIIKIHVLFLQEISTLIFWTKVACSQKLSAKITVK